VPSRWTWPATIRPLDHAARLAADSIWTSIGATDRVIVQAIDQAGNASPVVEWPKP